MKKLKNVEIAGDRIYLRRLEARDRDEFIALNRASKRLHRGLVSPPTVAADFRKLIEGCRRPDILCFVMCRVDDGAIVGSINLSQIVRGGFQNAYLGYYIGAEFAGKGYTSEAVVLVLEYAFELLRLHRVEANIQPSNWFIGCTGGTIFGYRNRPCAPSAS